MNEKQLRAQSSVSAHLGVTRNAYSSSSLCSTSPPVCSEKKSGQRRVFSFPCYFLFFPRSETTSFSKETAVFHAPKSNRNAGFPVATHLWGGLKSLP